jgi:membrane protease YdiL (CAAX protease family)
MGYVSRKEWIMALATTHKVSQLAPDSTIFLIGSLLQVGVVFWGVPSLTAAGIEPMAAWMLLSLPFIFAPIIALGLAVLRIEPQPRSWIERLRLQRPSARDWLWGCLAVLGLVVGSGLMFGLCKALGLDPNAPFSRGMQPLTGERLWMLGLWAIYWPINILGEELVWRGILLPRMEARLGDRAWQLNALLWGIFHLAFGLGNVLVLIPTLILVPLIAQRRRNTWLAVLLHAGLSGPGFIALALGLV